MTDLETADTGRPKLFKAKLKRWGFSKYITNRLEREALQHVVSNGLHREGAVAPETVRLSNGVTISLSSLVTHLDRKRAASSLHPMAVYRPLRSPDTIYISEEMLANAREYILKESTTDHDVRAILPLHFGDLCRGFTAVRRLLQERRVEDALLVLRQAPDQIRASLFGPAASNAFGCICMTVLCVKWDGSKEQYMNATLRSLLRYAAYLVQENSGPEHLRRILVRLAEVDDSIFREAAIQAWRCEVQTWTSVMQPNWSIPLLSEWLALAEVAGFDQLPPDFGSALEDTISIYEAQYGMESLPHLTLLWFQAEYERLGAEYLGGSLVKTQALFRSLLNRGPELDLLIRYAGQYFLAKQCRRSGDRESAERFLRQGIDSFCALEHRPCYGMSAVLEMMFDLERWLTEWGEHGKAIETRQRRLDIVSRKKAGFVEQSSKDES